MKLQQNFTLKNTIPFLTINDYNLYLKLKCFGVQLPTFLDQLYEKEISPNSNKKKEDKHFVEVKSFVYYGNMLFNWETNYASYNKHQIFFLNLDRKEKLIFSFPLMHEEGNFLNRQSEDYEYSFLHLPSFYGLNKNKNQLWYARFYSLNTNKQKLNYFVFNISKFIHFKPSFLYLGHLLTNKNTSINIQKFKNLVKKNKLWFYGESFKFWNDWLVFRFLKSKRKKWLIKKRIKLKFFYRNFLEPFVNIQNDASVITKDQKLLDKKITELCLKLKKVFSKTLNFKLRSVLKSRPVKFLNYFIKNKIYTIGFIKILRRFDHIFKKRKQLKEKAKQDEKKSKKTIRYTKWYSKKFYQLATPKNTSCFYLKPLRLMKFPRKVNIHFDRFFFKIKARKKMDMNAFKARPVEIFTKPSLKTFTVVSDIKYLFLIQHFQVKLSYTEIKLHFPKIKSI
jgi:hypothetical protein